MNKSKCRVESKTLSEEQLERARKQVKEWEDGDCLKMAILHHLGQTYTVSGTYEGDEFVINLS